MDANIFTFVANKRPFPKEKDFIHTKTAINTKQNKTKTEKKTTVQQFSFFLKFEFSI